MARQSKAKELQNTQRELDFNTPCPAIPQEDRNPLIQSASKSVMIEYSDSLGRQVVAARDIEPGEIIAIEKPFAKTLIGNLLLQLFNLNVLKLIVLSRAVLYALPSLPKVVLHSDSVHQMHPGNVL